MTTTVPTPLAPLVQRFFTERLIRQLGASANTIKSYRDTFKLLLDFAEEGCAKASWDMDVADIDADLVADFLDHLESERGNSAKSRNIRLAAIRSFFGHVAVNEPQVLHHCQKILQLPTKRHQKTTISWLTSDEVTALVAAPDLTTWYGRRDRALLMLATQTGLRVSELTGLRIRDVSLGHGAHVRCRGKGRKDRATPLRSDTVNVVRTWIDERRDVDDAPLFPSNRDGPLSRDAVERLVARHCRTAANACPTLTDKNITPHSLRHTAAMALLQQGVGCTVIALWLGHESVETTQIYLHADLRIKERAMEQTRPIGVKPGRFKPDKGLRDFLNSL